MPIEYVLDHDSLFNLLLLYISKVGKKGLDLRNAGADITKPSNGLIQKLTEEFLDDLVSDKKKKQIKQSSKDGNMQYCRIVVGKTPKNEEN